MFAVRGTHDLALGRTSGVDESFELDAGEDVLEPGVTVFVHFRGIVGFDSRGHDNGADLHRDFLVGHVEMDAPLLAGLDALGAHGRVVPEAFIDVEDIGRRHRLGERRINGLAG